MKRTSWAAISIRFGPTLECLFALSLTSNRAGLRSFLTCWFTPEQESLTRDDLRPEVAGFGVPALSLRRDPKGNPHFSCRLPPGLESGWYDVRVRTKGSEFSNPCKIAVGLPVQGAPVVQAACDGLTWRQDEVIRNDSGEGYLTLWIGGLGETCDRNHVRVYFDGRRLPVEYVSEPHDGIRQVNATVVDSLGEGVFAMIVRCGANESSPRQISVTR